MSWQTQKKWSDQFLPEIKAILGLYLIGEPPVEEDQERNTDLMVMKMDAVRIGCRVRTKFYFDDLQWRNEFTIRSRAKNGGHTELDKIIEGWGNFFFYGFGDDSGLLKWTLADMNIFRSWFHDQMQEFNGRRPGSPQYNNDGTQFMAYKWVALPGKFVVASSDTMQDVCISRVIQQPSNGLDRSATKQPDIPMTDW